LEEIQLLKWIIYNKTASVKISSLVAEVRFPKAITQLSLTLNSHSPLPNYFKRLSQINLRIQVFEQSIYPGVKAITTAGVSYQTDSLIIDQVNYKNNY